MAPKWLPQNQFGWTSLASGVFAIVLYVTQRVWDWFGTEASHKVIFSLIILIPLCFALGTAIETNRKPPSWIRAGRYTFVLFLCVIVFVILLQGAAMNMDAAAAAWAKGTGLGVFDGLRLLSNVTAADVGEILLWGEGLKGIIRALFLIVPFLCAVWGGLSVLTAKSIGEAQGGILAIVASIVVVIVVWLFKLVEVTVA